MALLHCILLQEILSWHLKICFQFWNQKILVASCVSQPSFELRLKMIETARDHYNFGYGYLSSHLNFS